jgi:hypothetical protein
VRQALLDAKRPREQPIGGVDTNLQSQPDERAPVIAGNDIQRCE